MAKQPQRYPLAWPAHRPRRRADQRIRGQFSETVNKETGKKSRTITMSTAADRLEAEIERMGGVYPILSSNVELRMDGRPRADRAAPADPGVCVYFAIKSTPYAMACDTYTEVAQNIAALANHIEALRRIERYGVATAAEMLHDFQALPAPDHKLPQRKPWRFLLGLSDSWPPDGLHMDTVRDTITRHYRAEAIKSQHDQGALADLNIARDAALQEFK